MKMKLLTAGLGLALSIGAINANAQKTYTSGVVSYPTEVRGQPAEAKQYFSPDSSAIIVTFGAGNFKILTTAKHNYVAVVLNIPIANLKKAGIATPAEMEEMGAAIPTFTFTPTTEAKQISGFNCKKVVAKDGKSGKTYDVWITNDVVMPTTAYPYYYASIGGFPIKYTAFQQGQEVSITVRSITDDKAPAGVYAIGSDYEKGTLADLR